MEIGTGNFQLQVVYYSMLLWCLTMQVQISTLNETVRLLYRDNDSLTQERNKLRLQVRMLEEQAAEANRKV